MEEQFRIFNMWVKREQAGFKLEGPKGVLGSRLSKVIFPGLSH